MSYMSTIQLLEKLGENHDAKEYEWKTVFVSTSGNCPGTYTVRSESIALLIIVHACSDRFRIETMKNVTFYIQVLMHSLRIATAAVAHEPIQL